MITLNTQNTICIFVTASDNSIACQSWVCDKSIGIKPEMSMKCSSY